MDHWLAPFFFVAPENLLNFLNLRKHNCLVTPLQMGSLTSSFLCRLASLGQGTAGPVAKPDHTGDSWSADDDFPSRPPKERDETTRTHGVVVIASSPAL